MNTDTKPKFVLFKPKCPICKKLLNYNNSRLVFDIDLNSGNTISREICEICYCKIFDNKNQQLQLLKQHDRELVKEVCERIRKTIASTVDLAESNQQIKDQFHIILDLVEKEYEK